MFVHAAQPYSSDEKNQQQKNIREKALFSEAKTYL